MLFAALRRRVFATISPRSYFVGVGLLNVNEISGLAQASSISGLTDGLRACRPWISSRIVVALIPFFYSFNRRDISQ